MFFGGMGHGGGYQVWFSKQKKQENNGAKEVEMIFKWCSRLFL